MAVDNRADLLQGVMRETGTSQSALARLSGVRQPSISQFLSGRATFSDEQLDRLLACMGRRLVVVREAVSPTLTRSEHRSWLLHRHLSSRLTDQTMSEWAPTMRRNLLRQRGQVTGQPHERNLERWSALVESADLLGMKRVLTGLDRHSIEMREVSPMSGLLTDDERRQVLNRAS